MSKDNSNLSLKSDIKINLTLEEWKNKLNHAQLQVTRFGATEPSDLTTLDGGWDDHYEQGE